MRPFVSRLQPIGYQVVYHRLVWFGTQRTKITCPSSKQTGLRKILQTGRNKLADVGLGLAVNIVTTATKEVV